MIRCPSLNPCSGRVLTFPPIWVNDLFAPDLAGLAALESVELLHGGDEPAHAVVGVTVLVNRVYVRRGFEALVECREHL